VVQFNQGEGKSQNFEKKADGCEGPYLSYLKTAETIETYARWENAFHKIGVVHCNAGKGKMCKLVSDWSTACNGTTCNLREFHIQTQDREENLAELVF
jgi:hypothetical protein